MTIESMKEWCKDNYSQGADTMVECWDDEDYQRLIDDCEGNYDAAQELLERIAAVYSEQQADAAYYRSQV